MDSDDKPKAFISTGMPGGPLSGNKRLWYGLIIAAAIVLLTGITWAVVTHTKNNEQAATAAKQTEGPAVSLTMRGITPATIKVKAGQEVTWINQDTREHRLTADQSSLAGYDSVDALAKGDSYTFTFDNKGTFHYYDPADPKGYNGTVVVD
ncbi:MAG TPA: cupredoxin domain-containing protein [Candidatus Saccharimonadales bacterium]|nr:cupredoxin domain-containing protein [Candidatus Saccharimonadales bacterium]